MARPVKESMHYFSHDTDARADRKMKLFIANTGVVGYGVFWGICEDIYNNSYFTPWTEEDQHLFMADFNSAFYTLSFDQLAEITAHALRWGLFDQKVFDAHQVLTSASIQRRYLKQSARRLLVTMHQDYLCLDLKGFYQRELDSSPVSVRLVGPDGQEIDLHGKYIEPPAKPRPNRPPDPEPEAKAQENGQAGDYEEKYDFTSEHRWDGSQPIDYKACVYLWNKINGGSLRVSEAKRKDLRRAFDNYTGQECREAMVIRAKDERMKDSKYKTQWSTLFGAKKQENLDKWVDRAREWTREQQALHSPEDHKKQGWVDEKQYRQIAEQRGIDPADATFYDMKVVDGDVLLNPLFDY